MKEKNQKMKTEKYLVKKKLEKTPNWRFFYFKIQGRQKKIPAKKYKKNYPPQKNK